MSNLVLPAPGCLESIFKKFSAGSVCRSKRRMRAGVIEIDSENYLLQSAALLGPVIAEPSCLGKIAAAYALSFIYAAGAEPISALNITGYPIKSEDPKALIDMLNGGAEKLHEAQVPILGGHSINDPLVKCGYAVSGIVKKKDFISIDGARPGDTLVITKPIGTGIICHAHKSKSNSHLLKSDIESAYSTMGMLDLKAAKLMKEAGCTAASELSEWGLAGHAWEMAEQAKLTFEINLDKVPITPGALSCCERGFLPDALKANRDFFTKHFCFENHAAGPKRELLFDVLISGGLLITLPGDRSADFTARLVSLGFTGAAVIGKVMPRMGKEAGVIV